MTRKEYETKKEELIEEIERAFGDMERDSQVTGFIEKLSDYQIQKQDKELLQAGSRWRDVPDSWFKEERFSLLIYADGHSFRYYLPAYLSWFLRFMDRQEDYFYSSTFRTVNFILMLFERRREWTLKKFSLLSPEQAQAVAHFLVFQCERMIFLYEQEESGEFNPWQERLGFRIERGYKSQYQQFQWTLGNYWGQFLGDDFSQPDFPFSAERRRWRELWKVPDPQKRAVYEAKKKALIEEIERAFDGVERGDGVTLHEASAIDDYEGPEERAKARLLDTETRWQDVPDSALAGTGERLFFLDDKGFHYYFPAYLLSFLRWEDSEAEDSYGSAFGHIDYILGGGVSEPLDEQFRLFSAEQKRAIAHFLQFKHDQLDFYVERWNIRREPEEDSEEEEDDDDDEPWPESGHRKIQDALDNYWGQFL